MSYDLANITRSGGIYHVMYLWAMTSPRLARAGELPGDKAHASTGDVAVEVPAADSERREDSVGVPLAT
ncbi:MAG: hypothetical protein HYX91_02395 [Chloroflexi bacterium]|nr:hypothetical protein [Chloroflexota bacterium]